MTSPCDADVGARFCVTYDAHVVEDVPHTSSAPPIVRLQQSMIDDLRDSDESK
jgi:hypothetical protein